jgi:outer membrane immunogenic protein
MYKYVATTAVLGLSLGLGAVASAADLGPAAPAPVYTKAPLAPQSIYNWTGFYAGLVGGGGWAHTSQADTSGVTTGGYSQSGATVGGTLGYNFQFSNVVLGVEVDGSWANIDGSITNPVCSEGGGTVCFTNLQWLNTDRARLGFAVNQFLPYITAGAASAGIKAGQLSCSSVPAGANAVCGTNTEWGWTAGGGVEAMIVPKWSAKIEYLYADFGTHQAYTVFIPVDVTEKPVNIIRAGLNYHF